MQPAGMITKQRKQKKETGRKKRVFGKKNAKKGQAATEYLILLAIVLIVSLSVISTFIDFSEITRSFGARTVIDFWKNADIAITAHTFYSNGTGVLILRNNKGYPILIEKIMIDDTEHMIEVTIYPGRHSTIMLEGLSAGDAGTYYSKKIWFIYSDAEHPLRGNFVYNPGIEITGTYE